MCLFIEAQAEVRRAAMLEGEEEEYKRMAKMKARDAQGQRHKKPG